MKRLKAIITTHLAATRVAVDEMRLRKLVKSTPLLDDYKYRYEDLDSMLMTRQRFRVCAIKGHIWELESYEPGREGKTNNTSAIGSIKPNNTSDSGSIVGPETFPPTYNLKCIRCFPHAHSKMAVRSSHVFN